MSYTYLGCDVSLRHGGFVSYKTETGKHNFWYYTPAKTHAVRYTTGYHLPTDKIETDSFAIHRLEKIKAIFEDVLNKAIPDYVGIEGYAYSKANQAHQLGEIGGLIRHTLWTRRIPYQVYAPKIVKKFCTSSGNSDKMTMIAYSWSKWKFPGTAIELSLDTLGDLSDACAISHMVEQEHYAKQGRLSDDMNEYAVIKKLSTRNWIVA